MGRTVFAIAFAGLVFATGTAQSAPLTGEHGRHVPRGLALQFLAVNICRNRVGLIISVTTGGTCVATLNGLTGARAT